VNNQQSEQVIRTSDQEQLDGRLVRVSEVTPAQRNQMFELMGRYYNNMCRDAFEQDLAEKDWVILATDLMSNCVMGFSTQVMLEVEGTSDSGKPSKVLFSGDTIVERAFWSRNPLAQIWGRLVLTLLDQYPSHDLFWFLISKGFRTYRFLPVFFREFFPKFDAPNPDWANQLISQMGNQRYPELFDAVSGIVRANEHGCKLREGVGEITPQRLTNKHVDFFHHANPGHKRGDELCCIARLSRDNFKRGAYRVIGDEQAVVL